jgi:hypothetical protein
VTRRLTGILILAAATAVVVLLALLSGPPEETGKPKPDLTRRLEKLRSLPYTSITTNEVDSTLFGVQVYDPDRTYDGYNLYCLRNIPEVTLMDMTGEIVHRWEYGDLGPYGSIHAVMLPGGDVIAIVRAGLQTLVIRMTWDSQILWKIEAPAHHDIVPLPDGTFYILVEDIMRYRGLLVDFSAIVHYSAQGGELERRSFLDLLDNMKQTFDQAWFLDTVLDSLGISDDSTLSDEDMPDDLGNFRKRRKRLVYDYFHPNALSLLPDTPLGRKDERFRKGNLLACFRNVNQVAILDGETWKVVWVWGEGDLEWPHDPTMLDNGDILIFDNGVDREASRVIELNPVRFTIEWQYGTRPEEHFYSFSKGSAQRLPNGNTLICDSDNGRALEVTAEGETVWEWFGPITEKKRRVQIYRMERIPPEAVRPLLAEHSGETVGRTVR